MTLLGGAQVDHLYEDEADHAQSLGAAAVLDEIAKGRHLQPGHPVRRTAHHLRAASLAWTRLLRIGNGGDPASVKRFPLFDIV
jgi:hypothetical protein